MAWDDFSDDLFVFAEQLGLEEATERTGNGLLTIHPYLERSWRTRRAMSVVRGVPLPCPRKKGLHPRNADVADAEISFAFELGDEWDTIKIPYRADFQVRVCGYLELENCIVDLEDHWRVDSHAFPTNPPPREPHPYIHFQRGGHAQDSFASAVSFVPGDGLDNKGVVEWRGLLQSPGPRIPFAPHCPILAIDFSIGQHDGDVWKALREKPEYRDIIARAQQRLWTPFFDGLASQDVRARWMGPVLVL